MILLFYPFWVVLGLLCLSHGCTPVSNQCDRSASSALKTSSTERLCAARVFHGKSYSSMVYANLYLIGTMIKRSHPYRFCKIYSIDHFFGNHESSISTFGYPRLNLIPQISGVETFTLVPSVQATPCLQHAMNHTSRV